MGEQKVFMATRPPGYSCIAITTAGNRRQTRIVCMYVEVASDLRLKQKFWWVG